MSKITLLYHPDEHSNFTAAHLEPLWRKYFNLESVDLTKTYNKQSSILVTRQLNSTHWFEPWHQQGYKLLIDTLWDNDITCSSSVENNCLRLRAPNWAWFNESIWYKNLKYDELVLERNVSRFFLTLMRLKKPHRNMLFRKIKKFSDVSLISYTSENVFISGDIDPANNNWQRHVNVDWYNSTLFSLVAETIVTSPVFMSEKTFKPIAFKQPFIVWGSPNTLDYLHTHGFETFDHVIDEVYDKELNDVARLELILHQTELLYQRFVENPGFFNDSITIEKLEHNFNRFYDQALMEQMLVTEVINPILEFANVQ